MRTNRLVYSVSAAGLRTFAARLINHRSSSGRDTLKLEVTCGDEMEFVHCHLH